MKSFKRFEIAAMRTANNLTQEQMVFNGVLGLNGESGEIADILKKHLFQGHELDREKLIEELGDVLWYCALLAKGLDIELSEVAQRNVDKLHKRYPNQFDPNLSINRKGELE